VQPDYSTITDRLAITEPVIGLYDAPDPAPFEPLMKTGGRHCVFASLGSWRKGRTLHLTRDNNPQCGGSHLVGAEARSREQTVDFLCGQEGLRATPTLMNLWLDSLGRFEPVHDHLLIGPLRPSQYQYLRTATFYVNPDQLSVLCAGASYLSRPDNGPPVIVPYGAGCMLLAALFDDLEKPQALIGATDHAMRKHLEPCMLAFTATKLMFEQLSQWAADPRSSLHSGFLSDLMRARGGSLA